MGLVLCLGPVTLFLMIWRMSRKAGCAFCVSLLYSVTSPARALLPETDLNPIRYWSSLRLYGVVVWDDLPHQTAMCFLPLALLFLWRSFENPRPLSYVLTVLFMALTVLASVFGATALLLGAACMLFVFPKEHFGRNLRLLLVLAVVAYLVVSPFLPPSVIAAIRSINRGSWRTGGRPAPLPRSRWWYADLSCSGGPWTAGPPSATCASLSCSRLSLPASR